MRTSRGFTLIDLMISVVVVAILAAVAYPGYQSYVRKGRRASAEAFMLQVSDREQQYLMDARTYALGDSALATLGVTAPAELSGVYSFTIGPDAPTSPPSFTITGTPVSGSSQASDGALTLDHLGNRTRAGHAGWQ